MIFRINSVAATVMLSASVLLAGCSSSPNVALQKSFWADNTQEPVVVAVAQPPQAKLDLSGPRTLIGRVSSKATTIRFSRYLKRYTLSGLSVAESQFVERLKANGIPVRRYAGVIPLSKLDKFADKDNKAYAELDYKPIAIQLGNDRLLLLSVNRYGAKREYVVVVPTSNPVAFCDAEGQLIDLKTNKLLWRYSVSKSITSGDDWDKGSNYKAFAKDLNQVVDQAMQALMGDFFSRAPR